MGIHDRDYLREELGPIRPWDNRSMVTLLIIANVAFFVANFLISSRTGWFTEMMVLHPSDLLSPLGWYHFVSYGFAHASLQHILFNMLGLYFLGQGVEAKLGKWEFFRFYMVALVTCGLIWAGIRLAMGGSLNEGVLGASGAVTAVAMLFVFSFPHSTLYIWGVLPVKAWVVGIVMILANFFGSQERVAYDVHLVGAGFAAVYFYGNLNFSSWSGVYKSWQTKLKTKRSGLKVHAPQATSNTTTAEEQESDRILEKIMKSGKDSLTRKEQAFMEDYSRKVRQRRERSS